MTPLLDKLAVAPVQSKKLFYSRQPLGNAVFLAITTMPSRIMPKAVSSVFTSPCSLTIRTSRPMRAFLLMIAPSMSLQAVAHAQRRLAVGLMGRDVVRGLVEVGPHQHRVANDHVAADAGNRRPITLFSITAPTSPAARR